MLTIAADPNLRSVWLRDPDDAPHLEDGSLSVRPEIVRAASIALAAYACNGDIGRVEGDPVYEMVTEGRQSANTARRKAGSNELPYSACGDLPHWILACLGVVDETLVNRTDDWGASPWKSQVNISRIANHEAFRRGAPPADGDVYFLDHVEHVEIAELWDAAGGTVIALGYGRFNRTRGLFSGERKRPPLVKVGKGWLVGGRPLVGSLDLSALRYMRPARVPLDFAYGVDV